MNKIQFKRIHAKNFRSINNMGMELLYAANGKTTMVGSLDNGAGKSTMLVHALYYALFDKSYGKGSTKTSLINSRSNKECLVEVELNANGHEWKIIRGQKPTVFDVFKDGVRIEDEAALKDYQVNIHKIIGMDEKVFNNTIALGRDKFIPFVDMSTPDRRAYGEQMLDVNIFSTMNTINKLRMKSAQTQLSELMQKISINETRKVGLINVINVKKQQAQNVVTDLMTRKDAAISVAQGETELVKSLNLEVGKLAERLEKVKESNAARNKVLEAKRQIQTAIDEGNAKLSQQLHNSNCPTCGQSLPKEQVQSVIDQINQKLSELKERMIRVDAMNLPVDQTSEMNDLHNQQMSLNGKISSSRSIATLKLNEAQELKAKIEQAQNQKVDWSEEEQHLISIQSEIDSFSKQIDETNGLILDLKVIDASLKDDGAKANIVNMVLPYLNQQVNQYLDKMNLVIGVEIDSDFELKMNAPDRKGQSIANLSSGQKSRVDLSVLLAWRDVARLSASCSSNLLILDEILEALSEQGVSDFVEMFRVSDQSEHTSLYVITQRTQEFQQFFDEAIMYKLKDGMYTELMDSE